MEVGRSSSLNRKYSTRTPINGIVFHEGRNTTAANTPTDVDNSTTNQSIPPSFKRDAEQYVPIAHVVRIMRRVLPDHARIADDAKETVQARVSEFISYITEEANTRCHADFRSTVTPGDVLSAMSSLGFDDYLDPLTAFLENHHAQDPKHGAPRPLARVRPPPALLSPPPTMTSGYVPTLPTTGSYEVDDNNNYVGLPEMGGGGGSSDGPGTEFDPFMQPFFK